MIAVVGMSGTGKTHLIQGLIREFKRRDLRPAVIKFTRHGFSLGQKTKDSHRFRSAGAVGVALLAPGEWTLFNESVKEITPREIAERFFTDADVILVEGGKKEKQIPKIEVLRKGVSEELTVPPEELIAVVSNIKTELQIPVFHPDQIPEIADFILLSIESEQPIHPEKGGQAAGQAVIPPKKCQEDLMKLTVDGMNVRMNAFVARIVSNLVEGMLGSLDGIPEPRVSATLRSGESVPVTLVVNGSDVELNEFVQKIFGNMLQGIISSLDDVAAEPDRIELIL